MLYVNSDVSDDTDFLKIEYQNLSQLERHKSNHVSLFWAIYLTAFGFITINSFLHYVIRHVQ